MIIRSSFKCLTCEQPHTVRIGMGQEDYQSHRFPCQGCGEDMVIGMRVDYQKLGWRTEAVENAEHTPETEGAPIVNVDANFIVPEDQRHKDRAFPRLQQMQAMVDVSEEVGSLGPASAIPAGMAGLRPFRRPDIAGEWKLLKKTWSLHRNGRDKLSRKRIEEASAEFYASDPIDNLQDWLWRFVLFLGQPSYEPKFNFLFAEIKPLIDTPGFNDFIDHYETGLSEERGKRYFDLMKAYFAAFSEYGQVYFHVAKGIDVPDGNVASSTDFDATRMFYGNAYEAFTSSVDVLAYLNNLAMGRAFDEFQSLTREKYLALDKASRFNPFLMNAPFTALCEETDNQLRNASHHGLFQFDAAMQTIRYRSGQGGTGPEQTLAYATYLVRCTRLFLQAMTLLRAEILMCHVAGKRPPL